MKWNSPWKAAWQKLNQKQAGNSYLRRASLRSNQSDYGHSDYVDYLGDVRNTASDVFGGLVNL